MGSNAGTVGGGVGHHAANETLHLAPDIFGLLRGLGDRNEVSNSLTYDKTRY